MQMDETTLEKKKRLSNLLSLKEPPTRVGLIKDLVSVTSRTLLYLSSLPSLQEPSLRDVIWFVYLSLIFSYTPASFLRSNFQDMFD